MINVKDLRKSFGGVQAVQGVSFALAAGEQRMHAGAGQRAHRFQADAAEAPAKPLPVLYSERLEETLQAVTNAGGTVVKPIFSFPGGRRFHFVDPAGNELAVWGE